MQFIKIGNRFFSTADIAWAETIPDKNRVQVGLKSSSTIHFAFEGHEAEALIKFLCDPNHTQDLLARGNDIEDYQHYRQRGGNMTFEDHGIALRRQTTLCAIEYPTETQLAQCSELEDKLLL
jgi:hypothetical protein